MIRLLVVLVTVGLSTAAPAHEAATSAAATREISFAQDDAKDIRGDPAVIEHEMAGLTGAKSVDFLRSSDAYLGQTPPGETPVVFAPDVVSLPGEKVATLTFSPDGRQLQTGVQF